MALQAFFLRHGETVFSKADGFCGSTDADLTADGEVMACSFAEAYGKTKWDAIYCSPMKRTIATANPIATIAGLQPQLRDGLRELNYGEWEGKTRAEVKASFGDDYTKWSSEPGWNSPTGGETAFEIAQRSGAVIEEIVANHREGNVLIVSHKATIRIMLCELMGIELGRYRDRLNVLTASVALVTFDTRGPMLQSMGDRSHLSAELRSRPGT